MSSDTGPFGYFGLDWKTATASDVKRAYARRLKETRPDDDPAGFMTLRQNMEFALREIKWREERAAQPADYYDYDYDYDEEEDYEEDEGDENALPSLPAEPPTPLATSVPSEPPEPLEIASIIRTPEGAEWTDTEDDADPFAAPPPQETDTVSRPTQPLNDHQIVAAAIQDVRELMDDPFRRQKWSDWLAILDRENLEGIDAFQLFSYRLRNLICQETSPEQGRTVARLSDRLSPEVLLQLDDRFGWSRQTGTDWVTRHENMWISRLVETAAIATGRKSITPWEKAQRELNQKLESRTPTAFSRRTQRMVAISWIIVRIVLIIALINFISYLLQD